MKKKALIAMSGGVDSSVAAALMKERGYDCIGITMKLYRNENITDTQEGDFAEKSSCNIQKGSRTCCSLKDVEDARRVALSLDIPYYVWNFTDDFREKVMKKFVACYEQGCTPNPCIDCNRYMKFEELYRRAKMLECDVIVTGHYARVGFDKNTGRHYLEKAVDINKDQSYVLYSLSDEQLAHTVFPLGELTKTEVRKIAEKYGFSNADKAESQDICFVPDGDYAGFIKKFTGKESNPGNFVNTDGKILGKHKGIIHYTIGQRRGLGISAPESLFVKEIRPEKNEVILGNADQLFSQKVMITDLHLNAPKSEFFGDGLKAKIRYRQQEQPVRIVTFHNVVSFDDTNTENMEIIFLSPQRAVTAGQALVIYKGNKVLGGGTIINDESF